MITALDIQTQFKAAFVAACPDLSTKSVAILCEDALDIATAAQTALGKVGIVGVISTPEFNLASQGNPASVSVEVTPRLEFYETATNRQKSGAVTALSCALYAAQNCPANYGWTSITQDSPGEGILRATLNLAATLDLTPTTQTEEN